MAIGSHMSKQCFGGLRLKEGDDAVRLQKSEMHAGCAPAPARHPRGQKEHVCMGWFIRLMGCWHFSPRTVETPRRD